MATNVYGNGTNSTAGANNILFYYDKAGVKAANEVNIYGQWADRKSMPLNMGKTFKISKFLHIYDRELTDPEFVTKGYLTARNIADVTAGLTATDGTGAGLLEGSGATNKRSIKKITMETAFSRYGEMIDYTDEAIMFSEDALQVRYREELGRLANRRMEDLIQLDMLSTSNTMFSSASTAITHVGTVDGGTTKIAADGSEDDTQKISYDLIRKAARKLVRNRAEKNTSIVTGSTKIDTRTINKAFYAIVGPEVKFDLESTVRGNVTDNGMTEWAYIPAYKYGAATNLAEGEIGSMGDVRFIESESAVVYAGRGSAIPVGYAGTLSTTTFGTDAEAIASRGAGATAGTYFDVFPVLFPTKGAFATVGLKGYNKIKFNAQSPEKIELTNPYGTNGFFSYNMWYAGIILQEERLLKVMVAASA